MGQIQLQAQSGLFATVFDVNCTALLQGQDGWMAPGGFILGWHMGSLKVMPQSRRLSKTPADEQWELYKYVPGTLVQMQVGAVSSPCVSQGCKNTNVLSKDLMNQMQR